MKCPKCGYTSFDYLMECKKCGEILEDCRRALNLKMHEPTIFTNLGEESEPTYSNEDDLKLAESLGNSDIDQESIVFSEFQPPLADLPPADIPESADEVADVLANELKSDIGGDDFELELDTLTPLSEETGSEKTGDIVFNGFSSASDGLQDDTSISSAGSGKVSGKADLLESNNLAAANDRPAAGGDDFNLDLELPFDFSSPDSLKTESPEINENNKPEAGGVVELNLDDDESLDKILAELDGGDDQK